MSASTPTNVYGAVANALANPVAISEEEKLFQEAFERAKQKKQQLGTIPSLFNGLQTAKTADDVLRILQQERVRNTIWKDQDGRKWIKALNQLAGVIISLKPVVDQLVQIGSSVATPVWGGIAFIFGVIKDLSSTDETLKQVQHRLESSMERFRDYYNPMQPTKNSLRTALLQYYECIVIFVVDLQVEFARRWSTSIWKAVDRSVKDRVESFNKNVKDLIENVDWGACARSQNEMREQNAQILKKIDNIQSPVIVPHLPVSSVTRSFTYGIPNMLSPNFTGRTDIVQRIRDSHINKQGLKQTVIHGLGGVGKTQILLKYAEQYGTSAKHHKAYSSILFFDATTASGVLHGITLFAYHLRPNSTPEDQDRAIIADFHKWLRTQEDWLLIFDNVGSLDAVRDYLPPTNDIGHIIFSTRDKTCAQLLRRNTEPIEVLPMDDSNALELARCLAKKSDIAEDKTVETADRVVQFAKGLPLVIEQVIHNSLFNRRSIQKTLDLVTSKEDELLKQDNESSLRGPNSSIGAVVMQSMEDLKSRDVQAEALFKIMAYWSASSIPLLMIENGASKLPAYLQRKYTFDRGQVSRTDQRIVDRIDLPAKPEKFHLFDEDPFKADTWLKFLHLKENRTKYSDTDLPLDKTKLETALRAACEENSPIGRLFKNRDTVLQAVEILISAGLIRMKSGVDTLWIHDLFSDVTRAIIKRDERPHDSALAATTLVYLAFPVPINRSPRDREVLCHQYLPHALTCHKHLTTLGILNNLSLGPELSHIIASTFCMRAPLDDIKWPPAGSASPLDLIRAKKRERNENAIHYYKSALEGYRKSQERVQSLPGVTPQRIIFAIVADEFRERQQGYVCDDFVDDLQRFGRTPHWRAMQTALRMSNLLEDGSFEDIEKSASMTRVALRMHEHFFGSDHDDTITTRKQLFNRLYDTGAFQEAYEVAVLGLQKLLGWSEEKQTYSGGKEEHKSFSASISAVFFCRGAGMCCLELPGAAKKSIAFFKVHLRYCQNMRGEEHFWCVEPMQKLALAFEMCDERLASIYWLARSVECALRSLEIEGHTFYEDEERERIIWHGNLVKSEAVMEETVACYEQAREKFGTFSERSLCKYLGATDSRIKLWRDDRQIWGSPYKEEASVGTEPAFPRNETEEEREARIQRDVEDWITSHQFEESTVVKVEEGPSQSIT